MKRTVVTPEKRKWIRLTWACNNRCLFCLDADALNGKCEPVAAVASELREGAQGGCRRVVLSGGEPTIHPDFLSIVGLARESGYTHIQAVTNGRMFCYGDFLSRAVEAGLSEITFSVHGATPAQHDRLTGVPGSFAQTLLGIKNAKKVPGLIVSSDIVINRVNVSSLFRIIEMLYSLGVNEYDLLHLVPFGRAWDNWGELSYDPYANRDVFERVFRFAEAYGAVVWTNRFPPAFLEGNERYIQHPDKILDEVRGMRGVFNSYLRSGRKIFCRGERCRFCVLEQFCSDLGILRSQGFLDRVPPPPCLPSPAPRRRRVLLGADVMEVAAFYVKERMTVRSAACAGCPESPRCRGGDILGVMKKGFSVLSPARIRGGGSSGRGKHGPVCRK